MVMGSASMVSPAARPALAGAFVHSLPARGRGVASVSGPGAERQPAAAAPATVGGLPRRLSCRSVGPGLAVATVLALEANRRPRRWRTRRPGRTLALCAEGGVQAPGQEATSEGPSQPREFFPPHLKSKEVQYGLKVGKFVEGELRMVRNSRFVGSVKSGEEEIVVSGSHALNRALDGDTVVVERLEGAQAAEYEAAAKRMRHGVKGKKGRSEAEDVELALEATQNLTFRGKTKGRVVSVTRRNSRDLSGTFHRPGECENIAFGDISESDWVFVPADRRFPNALVKLDEDTGKDINDKRVVARLNVWDRFSEYPRATLAKEMGKIGDVDVESEMILMEHKISNEPWSEEVLACLPKDNYRPTEEDLKGRKDLRNLCVFSIDPPNCEDVDDALSVEKLESGNFRVGVHIADVTHYVKPGTALDTEAAERCTSVYLADRRIDMLPRSLTTDICSLRDDGTDRLTFTAMFELGPDADVKSESFFKSVIRSKGALSYKEAQDFLDSGPEDTSEMAQCVRWLSKLALNLRQKRREKGAVELNSEQELRFEFDEEGKPVSISKYEAYSTNQLIEEFMLLANQAVATVISNTFRKFSLLRQHSPPKEKDMEDLKKLLKCHGTQDFDYKTNKTLSASLDKVGKTGDEAFSRLVRMIATRCMQEAQYFCTGDFKPDKYSHFGLAMARYTHFTSPIRRYADVLVHRFLAASLGIAPLPEELRNQGVIRTTVGQVNHKHRMAQWADRASTELHRHLYFRAHGKVHAVGIVTRVTQNGGIQVSVEEYGAQASVEMNKFDWLVILEQQTVYGRPQSQYEGIQITVFDSVEVTVEADLEDGRFRALKMTFVGIPTKKDARTEAGTEAAVETGPAQAAPVPAQLAS